MKRIIILLILVVLLSGCEILNYDRNVYFVGGQSNATRLFSDTIKNNILKNEPNSIIVYQKHSGQSIQTWFNEGVQENYISDVNLIQDILKDDYKLKGFFWFQGESDSSDGQHLLYEERFFGMINQIKSDLNVNTFDIYMVVIDGKNPRVEDIRTVQQSVINENDNIYGIDSRGYNRYDTWHLTISEQKNIANDLYDLYDLYF